ALRVNALTTLALWFTEHRALPVGALVSLLSEALWVPRGKELREASQVRAIAEVTNLGALGLVCDAITKETKELRRQCEAFRGDLLERSADIERLGAQLQAAEHRADALRDRIQALERESEQTRDENEAKRRRLSLELETRR